MKHFKTKGTKGNALTKAEKNSPIKDPELPKRTESPKRGESKEPETNTLSPLAYVSIGVTIGAGAILIVHKLRVSKQKMNTQAGERLKYVFFSTDGRPIALPEKDVYAIKQMYDDGVLPSKIAEKFDLSTVMIYRIINSNVIDNQ